MVGLTKSCARELAQHNIRVNAVLPGFINTRMANAVPDKVMTKMLDRIPLSRVGNPHEVAAAVGFLASDSASAF